MKCPYCDHETSGKFCGKCGKRIDQIQDTKETDVINGVPCPECDYIIKGKFCGKCGYKLEQASAPIKAAEPKKASAQRRNGYIFWNVDPGQVAVKVSLDVLDRFAEAKGVIIEEGTRGLLYEAGELVTELGQGTYHFNEDTVRRQTAELLAQREGGLVGGIRQAGQFLTNLILGRPKKEGALTDDSPLAERVMSSVEGKRNLTLILAREGEFPLVFNLSQVPTQDLASDISIEVRCKIEDMKDFYSRYLLDRYQMSLQTLSFEVEEDVKHVVEGIAKGLSAQELDNNSSLRNRVKEALSDKDNVPLPIEFIRCLSCSGKREELERLQSLSEQLYVSELELEQLNKRNTFENLLKMESNRALIDAAKTQLDYTKAIQEIDQDNLLLEDERAKFEMLLSGKRRIREAQNEEEVQGALSAVQKSGLLRESEVRMLQKEISTREAKQELTQDHELDILEIAQRQASDEARLKWRESIEPRELELELQKKRREYEAEIEQDALKIEAERKRAAFEDERRVKTQELDQKEQLDQLDILERAQAVRQQREKAEHDRELEAERQKLAHERTMLREEVERFKGMTADEILAANPNLSDAQAHAIAEKAKAEAAASSGQAQVDLMKSQQAEMMDFVKEMARTNADIAAGRAQDREKEIDRSRKEASEAGNRAVDVVKSTVSAVYRSKEPSKQATPSEATSKEMSGRPCPKCEAIVPGGVEFCEECGARVEG